MFPCSSHHQPPAASPQLCRRERARCFGCPHTWLYCFSLACLLSADPCVCVFQACGPAFSTAVLPPRCQAPLLRYAALWRAPACTLPPTFLHFCHPMERTPAVCLLTTHAVTVRMAPATRSSCNPSHCTARDGVSRGAIGQEDLGRQFCRRLAAQASGGGGLMTCHMQLASADS